MKPSERIKEILDATNKKHGEPHDDETFLARGIDCVIKYLDEMHEQSLISTNK